MDDGEITAAASVPGKGEKPMGIYGGGDTTAASEAVEAIVVVAGGGRSGVHYVNEGRTEVTELD